MAIDPTQGAVAKYFAKVRLSHTYDDVRKRTAAILDHLPMIGRPVEEVIERFKKSIRMVLPPSQLFESLNVPYFGPVDGHDVASLVELFTAMSQLESPAVLHAYTRKGRGFMPAERQKSRFHSTGPFVINGNEVEPENRDADSPSFTDVFGRALVELALADERIVAITSAMCDGTGLKDFRERFPHRFYDVGIAESAAVDVAAGMAKEGLRPVVCIYSTFLQRSFDQIFQEVALQSLPVVFCIDRAGLVGADGPTHHGLMDIGFLRMMPNVVLASPASGRELESALRFAVGSDKCVCIRYPKDFADRVPEESVCGEPFELGRCVSVRTACRSDAVIASYGAVLPAALEAADKLALAGFKADVINARFACPVDERIVRAAQGKVLLTVEDHCASCGFGSAVTEAASRTGLMPAAFKIIGVPRRLIRHDRRKSQLIAAGINADDIFGIARELLEKRLNGSVRLPGDQTANG
jgi:1-deoxy-D-xylulose-5-phosphate synthase